MADTLTKLNPIDVEKGYPQWGRPIDPTAVPVKLDFTQDRKSDSTNFRETNGPFDQDATYEVSVFLAGFPKPFTSRMKGSEIAGMNAERQANYPFAQIAALPIYYLVAPSPPPA